MLLALRLLLLVFEILVLKILKFVGKEFCVRNTHTEHLRRRNIRYTEHFESIDFDLIEIVEEWYRSAIFESINCCAL